MSFENWRCYTLGEICSFTGGTVFPQKAQGGTQGTVPFIKVSDFNINGNERWIVNANNYVYQKDIKKLNAKLHPAYATVFAKIGIALTFNRRRLLSANTIIDNNLASATPYKEIIDPIYFYYLLLTIDFNKVISGTAVPYLNFSDLQKIEATIPDIPTQRRIAEILSALDDKIELNRQTNAALEAVAQALFKEWFVDFNFPGADGVLVESELGPIPKGWRVLPLDEVASFLNGLALQKFPPENEYDFLPVIKIRELKNGVTDSSDRATSNLPEKYIIHDGDLIFSWSGTLEVDFWVGGAGALNQHLFKVTSENYPLWFCYYWILYHLENFRNIAEEKTTTMGHIKREHLSSALCLIPDNFDGLNAVMSPIVEKMIENRKENISLNQIRDALLPKLMNGEIEV